MHGNSHTGSIVGYDMALGPNSMVHVVLKVGSQTDAHCETNMEADRGPLKKRTVYFIKGPASQVP